MVRDKGRTEPERTADIAHAVLTMAEQFDDPRPVGLGQCLERLEIERREKGLGGVGAKMIHARYSNECLLNRRLTNGSIVS